MHPFASHLYLLTSCPKSFFWHNWDPPTCKSYSVSCYMSVLHHILSVKKMFQDVPDVSHCIPGGAQKCLRCVPRCPRCFHKGQKCVPEYPRCAAILPLVLTQVTPATSLTPHFRSSVCRQWRRCSSSPSHLKTLLIWIFWHMDHQYCWANAM